ncbi:MAG: hypothetical protein R3A13_00920 [Bdellovibrionota bacterium]
MINQKSHLGVIIKLLKNFMQEFKFIFFWFIYNRFLFQAAPKVFNVNKAVSKNVLAVTSFLVLIGIALSSEWFYPFVGRFILSLVFLLSILNLLPLIANAQLDRQLSIGIPVLISLSALAISPILDLSLPIAVVPILWCVIAGAILGASQQFVAGFFGGQKISSIPGLFFSMFFTCSCILLIAAYLNQKNTGNVLWSLSYVFCKISILIYIYSSKSWKVFLNPFKTGLSFAIASGTIWALVGCYLLSKGILWLDLTIHAWALGWGLPLIMAVSLQIIGHLSGLTLIKEKYLLLMLIVWQIVPIFRSLYHQVPSYMTWVAGVITFLVLFIWAIALLKGIITIWLRQFQIKANEKVLQC